MCGRYSLEFDDEFFSRYKTVNRVSFETDPNIPPASIKPVIVVNSPHRVEMMVWGLIPFWEEKKEKPMGLANLRDDNLIEKAWGHRYLQHQRCLIPATGFYEWASIKEGKVPYYFHVKSTKYFSFAGLYSSYKHSVKGTGIKTYTIITTKPNKVVGPIHKRMPVILSLADEENWLNPDIVEIEQLKQFLKPYPDADMEVYPVDRRINNPANKDKVLLNR